MGNSKMRLRLMTSENKPYFDEPVKPDSKPGYKDSIEELKIPDQKLGHATKWTLKEAKGEYSKYKNPETGKYDFFYKYTFLLCLDERVALGLPETSLYLTLTKVPTFKFTEGKKTTEEYLDKKWLFHIFEVHGYADLMITEFKLPYKTQKSKIQYKKGDKIHRFLMNSSKFVGVVHCGSDEKTEWTPMTADFTANNQKNILVQIINNLDKGNGADVNDIIRFAEAKKIKLPLDLLAELEQEGSVYQPRPNFYKTMV